ncbi:hypothetical protein FEP42_04283 [Burkholderia multivorans]|uniref:hypothetical protein n=1 Tax=Burkholderia multivorans TaxID=87883 RepID=UPI00285E8EAE|nr:hypothetical protein [Burkholderia multivorans]MDR9124430.1 hypothetical protein [Burkholderia multivorans]
MWVYARDASSVLSDIPETKVAFKRLPAKWFRRALRQAEEAGRASAAKHPVPGQTLADRLFDVSEAARAIREFLDEHAPAHLPVRPDANDHEICMKARRIANDVAMRSYALSLHDALIVARNACSTYGIDMPDCESHRGSRRLFG